MPVAGHGREILDRLDQQLGPIGGILVFVEVVVSLERPVDETAVFDVRADKTQCHLVLEQWDVYGPLQPMVVIAAVRSRPGCGCLGLEPGRVGAPGDDADRAARGPKAEQRALRPAQYLDPVEVIRVEVRSDVLADTRKRQVVEVISDRRIAHRTGHAPYRHAAALAADLGHRHPRGQSERLEHGVDSPILQLASGDRRDREWRIEQRGPGTPFQGGYDDFLDDFIGVAFLSEPGHRKKQCPPPPPSNRPMANLRWRMNMSSFRAIAVPPQQ